MASPLRWYGGRGGDGDGQPLHGALQSDAALMGAAGRRSIGEGDGSEARGAGEAGGVG
jgi:hypothetical protein